MPAVETRGTREEFIARIADRYNLSAEEADRLSVLAKSTTERMMLMVQEAAGVVRNQPPGKIMDRRDEIIKMAVIYELLAGSAYGKLNQLRAVAPLVTLFQPTSEK